MISDRPDTMLVDEWHRLRRLAKHIVRAHTEGLYEICPLNHCEAACHVAVYWSDISALLITITCREHA